MPIRSSQSLVIDANIWIYLSWCGLVDAAFRLGSLHVPDLMRTKEPITELTWQDLQDRGTTFDELTPDSVRTLAEIKDTSRGVSVCDVACLVLAEQISVPLVTHDTDLYKLALRRHVPLYNYYALLELMIEEAIIDKHDQQMAFGTLIAHGMRPK
jgi:hypothetical protein